VCVHMCVFITQVVMVLHSSLGQPQVIRIGDWWEGGTSSVIRTHFRGPRLSVLKGFTLTFPLTCVTMCFHSIKLSYCDRDHLSNGALYKNIHININDVITQCLGPCYLHGAHAADELCSIQLSAV